MALIHDGPISSKLVSQVKNHIFIQCGSPNGLYVREHFLAGFNPTEFESGLAENEDDCVAVVCMGAKATEKLTGFPAQIGTILPYHFGSGRGGRKVLVLTTFRVSELNGVKEEYVNRFNLVKLHLHRLALAAGLIERV